MSDSSQTDEKIEESNSRDVRKLYNSAMMPGWLCCITLVAAFFIGWNLTVKEAHGSTSEAATESTAEATVSSESDSDSSDVAEPITADSGVVNWSWEEIGAVNDLLEQAETSSDVDEITEHYGLTDSSGNLKNISFVVDESNPNLTVRLIDISKDSDTDGFCMTFMFVDAVDYRAMSDDGTTSWEESSLREWLNGDFYDSLPDDLKSEIKEVTLTTYSSGTAQETTDKIWLPSLTQVSGGLPESYFGGEYTDIINDYNQEGDQFRYYFENDVDPTVETGKGLTGARQDDNQMAWWTRSMIPAELSHDGQAHFVVVDPADKEAPGPFDFVHDRSSTAEYGVIPCFSL
ncbi:MAG: DUF6273 domain-containing protein [Tractidigestivibacter sp.]|uniref:DUF6273 domain-containing protein n=1 Tax=Tractidigestivibacter sp. TaxID=2847320 RepID=UPI003D8A98A1